MFIVSCKKLKYKMAKLIPLKLLYATSFDDNHPPTNAANQEDGTFWITTGLFPQEISFSFANPCQIMRVTVVTGKVKNLKLFAASDSECTEWVHIDDFSFQSAPIKQIDTHQINMRSTSYGIKLSIEQAWGPFSALYSLSVEGPIVHE